MVGRTEPEVRVTVRIPLTLHRVLTARAAYDHRTLNREILHLLERAFAAERLFTSGQPLPSDTIERLATLPPAG